MNPKISIITVTYNCASILEETINSVFEQTYSNIEYIIIDGYSTDGTVDIIKKNEDKIAYWCSEKDRGIFDAMNKGTRYVTGEWVNFMNAGDCFVNNEILSKVFSREAYGEFGIIHGEYFSRKNNKLEYYKLIPFYKNLHKIKGMGFSHQSVFIKKELMKNHPFDLKFKLSADYNQIYNLYYKDHVVFRQLDYVIAIMEGDDGASQRNYRLQLCEVCKICDYNNPIKRWFFIEKEMTINKLRLLKRFFCKYILNVN